MNGHAFLRFVAAVGVSVLLIIADVQWRAFDELRNDLSKVLQPFRYVAELPLRVYDEVREYFGFRENLINEKRALEEQLRQQTAQLNSLDYFVERYQEMRRMLNLSTKTLGDNWIAAEVRSELARIQQNNIYLNRGVDDGVLPGMTVLDEQGVVGQIVRVEANESEVNLLSNAQQWIAARVERTGHLVVVHGTGEDMLEIDSISGNADLRLGDLLRAEGGVFPPGYPVGTVEEISRGVRYLNAQVRPASDFYRRQVLLIYTVAPQELQ